MCSSNKIEVNIRNWIRSLSMILTLWKPGLVTSKLFVMKALNIKIMQIFFHDTHYRVRLYISHHTLQILIRQLLFELTKWGLHCLQKCKNMLLHKETMLIILYRYTFQLSLWNMPKNVNNVPVSTFYFDGLVQNYWNSFTFVKELH